MYCITCILTWAVFKQPAPSCPQCNGPFDYLYTYRSLDGEILDTLTQEPTVLLLQADWFKPGERYTNLNAAVGERVAVGFDLGFGFGPASEIRSEGGGALRHGHGMYEVDEVLYFDLDEYDERVERYAQHNHFAYEGVGARIPNSNSNSANLGTPGRRAKRNARRRATDARADAHSPVSAAATTPPRAVIARAQSGSSLSSSSSGSPSLSRSSSDAGSGPTTVGAGSAPVTVSLELRSSSDSSSGSGSNEVTPKGTGQGKVSSAKAKRLAKQEAKQEKEAKKVATRKQQRQGALAAEAAEKERQREEQALEDIFSLKAHLCEVESAVAS